MLDGYQALGSASVTLDVLTDEPAGPTNLAAIVDRSPRTVRDHLATLLRLGLARRPSRGAYVIAPGWRKRLRVLAVEQGTAGLSAYRRRLAPIEQDDRADELIWKALTARGRCDLDTLQAETTIPRDDLRRRLNEFERYGAVHHSPTLGEWMPKSPSPTRELRTYHPAGDHTDPATGERYDVHRMPVEPGDTWLPAPGELDEIAEQAAEQLRLELPGFNPHDRPR